VKRREFITLLGGAAAVWPLAARGQQGERVRKVGVLMAYPESDREGQAFVAEFQKGLQKLGWAEGRNIRFDYRWAALDAKLMHRFAEELTALQPDLIFSHNTPTTAAILQYTRTIPIIFAVVADPVGSGFVESLPQPGGNVTGFIIRRAAIYADRILRGAKPNELPVQIPFKFDLVINLKTAKALGLDVPLLLQQRAD
jgi:putative tryptophan/tyrosine transport system substrate-binding protein